MFYIKVSYVATFIKRWFITMCLLSAHTSFAEDFAKHDERLNFSNTVISPGTLKNITLEIAQGVHGYEYTSIIAVNKWIAALNPRQMSNSVIIVRVAHVPAFEERSIYVNPYDRKNLNRSFL